MSRLNESMMSYVTEWSSDAKEWSKDDTKWQDARHYKVDRGIFDLLDDPLEVTNNEDCMRTIRFCLNDIDIRDIYCHEANFFHLRDNLTLTVYFCNWFKQNTGNGILYLYETTDQMFIMGPKPITDTLTLDQELLEVLHDLRADTSSINLLQDLVSECDRDHGFELGAQNVISVKDFDSCCSLSDFVKRGATEQASSQSSKRTRTDEEESTSSLSSLSEAESAEADSHFEAELEADSHSEAESAEADSQSEAESSEADSDSEASDLEFSFDLIEPESNGLILWTDNSCMLPFEFISSPDSDSESHDADSESD